MVKKKNAGKSLIPVLVKFPKSWITALDKEVRRTGVERARLIRELIRTSSQMKKHKLSQPPKRGEWKRPT